MMWLYILFCGCFYIGASLDEIPKGFFKQMLFVISCFIEGMIGAPMAIGAAVWLYIKHNDK